MSKEKKVPKGKGWMTYSVEILTKSQLGQP
jgi:hypothetical protein